MNKGVPTDIQLLVPRQAQCQRGSMEIGHLDPVGTNIYAETLQKLHYQGHRLDLRKTYQKAQEYARWRQAVAT